MWRNGIQSGEGGGRREGGECNDVPVSGKTPSPNGLLLAGCEVEHHARKVGLGETGDTALTGGGRSQGVGNFLQGGGAGNSTVWVGDVVPFDSNGEEGGRDTH